MFFHIAIKTNKGALAPLPHLVAADSDVELAVLDALDEGRPLVLVVGESGALRVLRVADLHGLAHAHCDAAALVREGR